MGVRDTFEIRKALILAQNYLPERPETWPPELRGCAAGTISALKWVLGEEGTFSETLESMKNLWQQASELN